jgi:hypothetical protein
LWLKVGSKTRWDPRTGGLGSNPGLSYFQGGVADVRLWPKALQAHEIRSLYEKPEFLPAFAKVDEKSLFCGDLQNSYCPQDDADFCTNEWTPYCPFGIASFVMSAGSLLCQRKADEGVCMSYGDTLTGNGTTVSINETELTRSEGWEYAIPDRGSHKVSGLQPTVASVDSVVR